MPATRAAHQRRVAGVARSYAGCRGRGLRLRGMSRAWPAPTGDVAGVACAYGGCRGRGPLLRGMSRAWPAPTRDVAGVAGSYAYGGLV
jgi:hypothetical protein